MGGNFTQYFYPCVPEQEGNSLQQEVISFLGKKGVEGGQMTTNYVFEEIQEKKDDGVLLLV